MKITFHTDLRLTVHGFSGTAVAKNYSETAFRLMDRMWAIVRARQLKHNGKNIWIYEPDESVFAGVELAVPAEQDTGLEQRKISLNNYAYCKHIGPYSLIKETGEFMRMELQAKSIEVTLPYIEIYGHWTADESKLDTELLMSIR